MDVAYPLVLLLFTLALSAMSSKIKIGSCSCCLRSGAVVDAMAVVEGAALERILVPFWSLVLNELGSNTSSLITREDVDNV